MLSQFIPHGHCYLWKSNLVGLHLVSDLIIALSYYSIPITLVYFVSKRKDLPYTSVFLLFGAFIISCGTSHLMEIWTLWHPHYWLSGILKAITALISLYTAVEMLSVVPLALELPSPSQLQQANKKLEAEIAERIQIETELDREKNFLHTLLDNLSDGIVACDREGILTLFNQATRNFHGLPQKAISAERWAEYYDLYLPDGQSIMSKDNIPLFRALKGERVRDVEMMIIPKQGKPRTLLANGDPLINSEGENIGAIVAMRDITEHKKAEQDLRESESILRSFYESAPMMMGIIESSDRQSFRHISHNNAARVLFGLTPETAKEEQASKLIISEANRQRLVDACRQSKSNRKPVNFEFTENIDQDTKDFAATVSTIFKESSAGRFRFSYLIEDISDRKRIEMVLQESEERFRLAFEDAATGMTTIALDGRFLKANLSLCKILGFERTELVNLTCHEITHPDDLSTDVEYFRQLLAGEITSCQLEKRYIHKLGHTVWILNSISLVRDLQNQPQYFLAQIQDISDRKAAETKLTKSLAEKVVMLQEIHHRVKNNLQVICSLLNLQSRYLTEESTIKAFKETQNRVRSMALVHEQLYQSTNFAQIVLFDYVKQLTGNLFRAYAITSQVKYRTEIDKFNLDLDTAVSCGLIINEIVSNALKYAFNLTAKGEILIKAFANKENSLVLIIQDNGKGLEPGFNLQKSKSLGLKLVKNLVRQLQGDFAIDSKLNSGTKFIFTFNRIKKQVI